MKRRSALALAELGVLVLSYALLAAFYPFLPERLPMHWNAAGQADASMEKPWIFLTMALPAFAPLATLLFAKLDPWGDEASQRRRPLDLVLAVFFLLFLVIAWLAVLEPLGIVGPDPDVWAVALLGLAFVIIGAVLPRAEPGGGGGIRVPWTLANEAVWRKTHRFAGILMICCGAIVVASSFLPSEIRAIAVLATILFFLGGTLGYSYHRSRTEPKET